MTKGTSRALLRLAVFAAAGIFASVAGAESSDSPHENYRVLEWTDLVPEGWEPPLVPTAYGEISEADVDEASVVQALDQQLVALPGYMKPTVFEGNVVTEFILVPYLPHQITAHAHLEPNQMIYVRALEPIAVEKPLQPIWIIGTLTLQAVMTDDGPAAYQMPDAVTTEYEY